MKRRQQDRLLSTMQQSPDPSLAAAAMLAERTEDLLDRLEAVERAPKSSNGGPKELLAWLLGLISVAVIALVATTIYHGNEIAVMKRTHADNGDLQALERTILGVIRNDVPPVWFLERVDGLERRINALEGR